MRVCFYIYIFLFVFGLTRGLWPCLPKLVKQQDDDGMDGGKRGGGGGLSNPLSSITRFLTNSRVEDPKIPTHPPPFQVKRL